MLPCFLGGIKDDVQTHVHEPQDSRVDDIEIIGYARLLHILIELA